MLAGCPTYTPGPDDARSDCDELVCPGADALMVLERDATGQSVFCRWDCASLDGADDGEVMIHFRREGDDACFYTYSENTFEMCW